MSAILHVDANNFFASVTIKNNLQLKGKPVIICGDPDRRHGIVLAKSNEAKKLGIKTATTIGEAKKICKDLICMPPDYAEYKKYSEKLYEIYKRYTPLVESFGMDECWLDVTGSTKLYGTPEEIANDIRETVKKELGITVSVGVSFTKTFAKLGSDMKKPDAVTVIDENNYKVKAWSLPVSDMIYVGDSVKKVLFENKIYTIGDLANTPIEKLSEICGKSGVKLHEYANGTDGEKVSAYNDEYIPESISNGTTGEEDVTSNRSARALIYSLSELVAFRLRKYNLIAYGVSINVKDASFRNESKQTRLETPTADANVIAQTAYNGIIKRFRVSEENPIRTIIVGVYNLKDENSVYRDMFAEEEEEKQSEINKRMDKLRDKYGFSILKRAIELDDKFYGIKKKTKKEDNDN